MIKLLNLILLLFFLGSCSQYSKEAKLTIELAGNNSNELRYVIEYYKNKKDNEKLEAAYFLIGNLKYYYTLYGSEIDKFDDLFNVPDSIQKEKDFYSTKLSFFSDKYDSIVRRASPFNFEKVLFTIDCHTISSKVLIETIEQAFEIRNKYNWSQKIKFRDFLEYNLPYRVGNEPVENWRGYLKNEYKSIRDSFGETGILNFAQKLNAKLSHNYFLDLTFQKLPFDLPVSKIEKIHHGSCKNIVNYTLMVMRANGLSVGSDYARLWGNRQKGHDWSFLIMENGKKIPFEAASKKSQSFKFEYRPSKIFRNSFSKVQFKLPSESDYFSMNLLKNYGIDVTNEYIKTYNICVPLFKTLPSNCKFAYICTFDNKDWQPQDWGKVKNSIGYFNNMGPDIVYIIMYLNKNQGLIPASNPFILTKNGEISFINSSSKIQKVNLYRKYPCFTYTQTSMESMVGGYFQASNNADFKLYKDLFIIDKAPEYFKKVSLNSCEKYRYVRYYFPKHPSASIAELEFYGIEHNDTVKLKGEIIGKQKIQVFDNNMETYFNSKGSDSVWIGLDLKIPQRIVKIGYCPRSDTNFITIGDEYKLCFWKNGEWITIGVQKAKEYFLVFDNVPSNSLYLLHDLTKGNEERIFTYENGKQVWW
jgi:hypothetical protein